MSFQYRLQPLLERKAARKEEAERELAARRQRLRGAETRLASARQHQDTLEQERAARRGGLLTGASDGLDLHRRVDDLALLGRRIEDAKDEVMSLRLEIEERKEQVEQAVAEVAMAARELEVLKKHRAKGERRFLAELERKDSAAQDEIASTLYEARRRA